MRQTTRSLETAVLAAHEDDERHAATCEALLSWLTKAERHSEDRRRALVAEFNSAHEQYLAELTYLRGQIEALKQALTGQQQERPQIALVAQTAGER